MVFGMDATQAIKLHKTGTEWYAYYLIQHFKTLIPKNIEVRLYSPEALNGRLGDLPTHFSSRVLRWPFGFLWNHLRLSWEMLTHPVDVLFVPSHVIPIVHPRKTLTVIHDVGFEEIPHLYARHRIGPKNRILSLLLGLVVRIMTLGKYSNTEYDYHRFGARFAARHAAQLLTVSTFSKEKIQHYYHVPEQRITVVPISHDTERYPGDISSEVAQQIVARYNVREPFVFSIGRLEEKKNTLYLVRAFHRFLQKTRMDFRLVLIGKPGLGFESVRAYIDEQRLGQHVILLGYVNESEVPAFYHRAAAFCFPSRYEGFGIPILEAFACGTPVVASNAGSIPEIAAGGALLSDPDDVEGFSENLARVLQDADLRNRLIEKGKARAAEFSYVKTSRTIWEIISELANRKT